MILMALLCQHHLDLQVIVLTAGLTCHQVTKQIVARADHPTVADMRHRLATATNVGNQQPTTARKPVSKLRYFDGKDWEAYKLHFLSCQISNRWNDEEAAAIVTSHLIGDTAFALTHVPLQERTLSALLNVLDERYDLVGSAYIIKGKLPRTVQQNNQSLQTFPDSIMRVTWFSYGEQVRR